MKRFVISGFASLLVFGFASAGVRAGDDEPLRLGIGAHYWTTVNNIDVHNIDKNGVSWLGSLQYAPSNWVKLEGDVEWMPSGFGGSTHDVYEPEAFLLIGNAIYAGAGIGGYYSGGDLSGDPFYVLRVGLDLEVLPRLRLDINANYRFEDWHSLNSQNISSDTITLGAALRVAL